MLRTPKNFVYDTFPAVLDSQYVIAVDDQISFQLQANEGINMVDVFQNFNQQGQINSNVATGSGLSFTVEYDGTVKLPVIGRFKIAGMTPRQSEDSLENSFSRMYKNPYVRITVSNRRVIVFPGGLGTAKVVPLTDQNMTLFEALAFTGGIDALGKAYKIKLIRGNLKKPYVFLIDASSIETIKQADLVLQADDIIYVEPIERPLAFFIKEVAPWIYVFTSSAGLAVTIYTLTKLLN
jgi:polysaccharide export outer membrane protein